MISDITSLFAVGSPSSSQNIEASPLHNSQGLFFFFGGIVILIILLILIFLFRNHIKPAKLMKMIALNKQQAPNKKQQGIKSKHQKSTVLEARISFTLIFFMNCCKIYTTFYYYSYWWIHVLLMLFVFFFSGKYDEPAEVVEMIVPTCKPKGSQKQQS